MNSEPFSMLTYPSRLRGLSIPLAQGAPYRAGVWDVLVERRMLGSGDKVFDAAHERILSWQMHRDAGLTVAPRDTFGDTLGNTLGDTLGNRVAVSAQVEISLRQLPWLAGRCEVVALRDTPASAGHRREAGFAYGTLPGHPEIGEEAFLVQQRPDGTVVGTVAAFSQPAAWYVQIARPVAKAAQLAMVRRYLTAMALRT